MPIPPDLAALASVVTAGTQRRQVLERIATRAEEVSRRAARAGTGAELAPHVAALAGLLAEQVRTEAAYAALTDAVTIRRRSVWQRLAAAWRAFVAG